MDGIMLFPWSRPSATTRGGSTGQGVIPSDPAAGASLSRVCSVHPLVHHISGHLVDKRPNVMCGRRRLPANTQADPRGEVIFFTTTFCH